MVFIESCMVCSMTRMALSVEERGATFDGCGQWIMVISLPPHWLYPLLYAAGQSSLSVGKDTFKPAIVSFVRSVIIGSNSLETDVAPKSETGLGLVS